MNPIFAQQAQQAATVAQQAAQAAQQAAQQAQLAAQQATSPTGVTFGAPLPTSAAQITAGPLGAVVSPWSAPVAGYTTFASPVPPQMVVPQIQQAAQQAQLAAQQAQQAAQQAQQAAQRIIY